MNHRAVEFPSAQIPTNGGSCDYIGYCAGLLELPEENCVPLVDVFYRGIETREALQGYNFGLVVSSANILRESAGLPRIGYSHKDFDPLKDLLYVAVVNDEQTEILEVGNLGDFGVKRQNTLGDPQTLEERMILLPDPHFTEKVWGVQYSVQDLSTVRSSVHPLRDVGR